MFTRQLGVRSYLIKGVRGRNARVKQNLLQPLTCLDMVVYNNPKTDLNYIKELSHRSLHKDNPAEGGMGHSVPIENALRFFMTEVLYKSLQEAEPLPALFDYVEDTNAQLSTPNAQLPILFLLTVARHLGLEPLDNYTSREPLFDLQEGRFTSMATETTLPPALSNMLHNYLHLPLSSFHFPLDERTALIDALLAYYQLHLSNFRNFTSHEILHTILK